MGFSSAAAVRPARVLSRALFSRTRTSSRLRYAFAAGCCAAAFLSRVVLEPLLSDHSPLIVFSLAVALAAVRGGFGPGVFATILSSLAAIYFFPPVAHPFYVYPEYRLTAAFQLLVFFGVALTLSWVGGELRSLRWSALDLAEQRNQILESISDGFQALDRDFRFVYLNGAAERFIGAARSVARGRSVWDLVPDLRGTAVEERFREAMEKRIPVHFEHRRGERWHEFHVHPVEQGGITVYFRDVTDRKDVETRLLQTLAERDAALEKVRLLSGLLPICASCKKIRDDKGQWSQVESYISGHSEAQFSHGLCPECARQYFGDLVDSV
jgi:PAS domain S-box-containing protein